MFRRKIGVVENFRPWTGRRAFRGVGLNRSPRVLDLLDCYVAAELKKQEALLLQNVDCERVDVEDLMQGKFMDVSQSLNRHAHTNANGCNHALTTSSVLYDFTRDCVLSGREMLALHGQPKDFIIPPDVPESVVRELAGEGMSIPSLSSVIWCLYLTRQFPE